MNDIAIKVEKLSKIYRLGEISTGRIGQDLDRWFKTKVMGKEDPFLKIGERNDRTQKGQSEVVYSLKDINFEIKQGDAVGIIGSNGAGKSTLLKILSRVTSPTTGRVNIKGRIASLLEVGTGFHPELTGRENIYLNGTILGMRKREIDRKLDEIIDFSGVERYIDTPVKRYSSGMYVRLAFAVAAHLESEMLIVDEVLAVGDAEFQKKCLGKMGEVSLGEGRTVLFVSHNLSSINRLCKKSILLNNGCLELFDSTNLVINKYQTEKIKNNNEFNFKNKCFNGVELLKLSIYSNGKNQLRLKTSDEIFLTLEYMNHNGNSNYGFTFGFWYNEEVVFVSMSNNISRNEKYSLNGKIALTCVIPANFLNDLQYSISVNIYSENYSNPITLKDVLNIKVEDSENLRYDFTGGFQGSIRPDLKWIIE